jgi:hypothetical protein
MNNDKATWALLVLLFGMLSILFVAVIVLSLDDNEITDRCYGYQTRIYESENGFQVMYDETCK